MVDIHCHILPKLDDGSDNLEESVAMARLAAASGVTDIVATPHFYGRPETLSMLPKSVLRLEQLQKALKQAGVPVVLHPGAEILCTPDTPKMGAQGMLPTLGDSRYLLTEFYFDESGDIITEILDTLAGQGYRPVVAHPERYAAVQQDAMLAWSWFDKGYVLQLNKGSVLGAFGRRARQSAGVLLRNGLAHLFASDAHGSEARTPYMTGLREWAGDNLEEHYAWILTEGNPARILRGEEMLPI